MSISADIETMAIFANLPESFEKAKIIDDHDLWLTSRTEFVQEATAYIRKSATANENNATGMVISKKDLCDALEFFDCVKTFNERSPIKIGNLPDFVAYDIVATHVNPWIDTPEGFNVWLEVSNMTVSKAFDTH